MVKFTVSVNKETNLKSLLSIGLESYVTVFVTKTSCYFILNSAEIYLHKALPILSSDSLEEALSFRLERKQLNNMLIDGFMEFLVDDEDITINFKNVESHLKYSMTVINQKGYDELIFQKMRLIADCEDYPLINLAPIRSLIRVANNLGLPIGVENGYAYAMSKNFSCFKKTSLPEFSASSKMLALLLKFSTQVHNVQNYLIHDEDGTAIVISKHKYAPAFDIVFALKQKSSHRVNLKIDNIIGLCAKVDKTDGTFLLDVENEKATFVKDKVTYMTPLDIIDIRSVYQRKKQREEIKKEAEVSIDSLLDNINPEAESVMLLSEHLTPRVEVPIIVLTRLMPALGLKESAIISYKKTFMQVEHNDTYVIFTRKEV